MSLIFKEHLVYLPNILY